MHSVDVKTPGLRGGTSNSTNCGGGMHSSECEGTRLDTGVGLTIGRGYWSGRKCIHLNGQCPRMHTRALACISTLAQHS